MYFLFETSNDFSGYNVAILSIITVLSILAGILIVVTKNPIISVLYLISLFIFIAIYLMLTGIMYIGLSYLLVYVGAVSILFLFILMLINIRVSELIEGANNNLPLGLMTVACFSKVEDSTSPNSRKDDYGIEDKTDTQVYYVSSNHWDNTMQDVTDISSIGSVMYTTHSVWLIITSIVLLLAMVGSILVTLKQK